MAVGVYLFPPRINWVPPPLLEGGLADRMGHTLCLSQLCKELGPRWCYCQLCVTMVTSFWARL